MEFEVERTSRKESRGSLDIGPTNMRYTKVQTLMWVKALLPDLLFSYMWML